MMQDMLKSNPLDKSSTEGDSWSCLVVKSKSFSSFRLNPNEQ